MNVRLSNPVINNFSGLEMELSLASSIFTINRKKFIYYAKKKTSFKTYLCFCCQGFKLKALCNNYRVQPIL